MLKNLNALEVLYMQLVDGKEARKINDYGMWRDVYSTDPNDILNSLLNKNIIVEDHSKKTLYAELKVSDLKEKLRENSLKLSGKKSELIDRLIENNINIDMDSYIISPIYRVNNKYIDIYNSTKFILFFHNRYFIDIFDAYDYFLKHPNQSNHDLIINIINRNIKKALSSKKYIEAMKMHSDLAKYFTDNDDTPSAQYHIHNQQMLNLLNDYERMKDYSSYGITIDSETDTYMFHISDWTLLQYKSILKTRQMSENTLKTEILNSTDHLTYSRELRSLFANYIIESIQNNPGSKSKLLFNIKNEMKNTNNSIGTEVTQNINTGIKASTNLNSNQNTKSGCLAFFLLPGAAFIYIIDKLINSFI